jgi:PAS domain S-box-containing protein
MPKQKQKQKTSKKKLSLPDILKMVPVDFLSKNLNYPITIFDGRNDKLIYANSSLCRLTGYSKEELQDLNLDEFLTYIHAKDLAIVVTDVINTVHATNKQYLEVKNHHISFTINYRFRKKDGNYVHVSVQNTVLEWDPVHQKMVTLNVYTDISNHKKDPVMHFKIDMFNPGNEEWKMVYEEKFRPQPQMLSKGEKGIMQMMLDGKSAKQIAEINYMNFYTVRSHWRNILNKTKCKSQEELKELAQKEGWI